MKKFLSRKLLIALLGVATAVINQDWQAAANIVMVYIGAQGLSDAVSAHNDQPNQ